MASDNTRLYMNMDLPTAAVNTIEEGIDQTDDEFDINAALPSQLASDIDENYFRSSNKQSILGALQRASRAFRSDYFRSRPLTISVPVSSPSVESRTFSSLDSTVGQRNAGFGLSDLRSSAIRRKVIKSAVDNEINVKPATNVKRYFPWNSVLEEIRSYFGRAAASYFSMIRFLFVLNFLVAVVVFCFLIVPYLAQTKAPNTPIAKAEDCSSVTQQLEPVLCNASRLGAYLRCSHEFRSILQESVNNATLISHITNLMRGQGYLTLSPLYYAYYTDILFNDRGPPFYGGFLYFGVMGFIFFGTFAALLIVSYFSVISSESHHSADFHYHFSNVVFSAWDHITATKDSTEMRQATLRRFLKSEIQGILRRKDIDTLAGVAFLRLWIIRLILMVVSLAIIVASVVIILITSSCSQNILENDTADRWLASFAADYLPPFVVVILNTFQPDIFVLIAKFENYAPGTEVKLILFRLILSRFATVITFVVPLLGFHIREVCPFKSSLNSQAVNSTCAVIQLEDSMGQKSYCWEANVGEQLYKLVIADLISALFLTFAYSFLRRILVDNILAEKKPTWAKKIGRREFELPVEVVNLFYVQTITWMGLYFMPLLPIFTAVTRFALFYMKRWDLFNNTYLTWRVRAARFVRSFYVAYLCSCFMVALSFTGYAASVMQPSPGCGPFAMSNGFSALHSAFNALLVSSPSTAGGANIMAHPLVAGSCVTIVCFVAICCHLYALSTKRRIKTIKQLINAERQLRDYYFSEILTTNNQHLSNNNVNNMNNNNRPHRRSSMFNLCCGGVGSESIATVLSPERSENFSVEDFGRTWPVRRAGDENADVSNSVHLPRPNPSELYHYHDEDVRHGSGVYYLRRQVSRF